MATVPAILGMARLGNFRLGYQPAALAAIRRTRVRIVLAGVWVSGAASSQRIRVAGLTIRDALNDVPNTCRLTVQGAAPVVGQTLRITINSDAPRVLFNGTLQTVDVSYEGRPAQKVWPCIATDDTARANRKRPFGTWTSISATTIAQALVATFAPGFTSTNVQAGLPLISITFDGSVTLSGALAQIAQLIGGYFYWEDLDLHLFLAEATEVPDTIDSTAKRFLDDPPIQAASDDSQLRNRVYGKGHGEPTTVDVAAGETIVPIENAVMFNAAGGQAIASTTPDGAQSQILTYTGVQLGDVGSLVGSRTVPSVALSPVAVAGAGVEVGVHQYAYTWVTAAGETLPSPLANVTTGVVTIPPPASGPNEIGTTGGALTTDRWYGYVVTYTTASGETTVGPVTANFLNSGFGSNAFLVANVPVSSAPTVTSRKVYRTTAQLTNAAALTAARFLCTTLADNTTTLFTDTLADGGLGAAPPSSNTATSQLQQVSLSGIAVGPAGVTSRKVYRTAAGLSQLKLQQTIANNTATTGVQDATADASLGANVPTSDTAGLATVVGQVLAGSTTLLTAGWALATAGWVELDGGQIVRYTGVSGNTLTGIPASGPGSIVTTVPYGSLVMLAPALTGVTGVLLAMQAGTPVHLWVTRNDLAAQGEAALRESTSAYSSDGIHEHVIVDERRGEASLSALCDADLVQFSRPIVTVVVDARDVKLKSGKPLMVNLASPPIVQTLTIQDVTITEIDVSPGTAPRFHVTASSVRVSLEDILRRLMAAQAN